MTTRSRAAFVPVLHGRCDHRGASSYAAARVRVPRAWNSRSKSVITAASAVGVLHGANCPAAAKTSCIWAK